MARNKDPITETGGNYAIRHGMRRTFALGRLPASCGWISRTVSSFRNELEALVCKARGVVGARDALLIQSAARHEQSALLVQRYLRINAESMTHGERLSYIESVGKQSDLRDRAIEKLKLDTDAKSMLDSLYALPTAIDQLPADLLAPDSKNQLHDGN